MSKFMRGMERTLIVHAEVSPQCQAGTVESEWDGSGPDPATVRTFTPERGACALRLDLEDFLGFVQPAEALIQLKHL